MALTSIAAPYPTFPIFTDENGNPLEDGYLYFGRVNEDPETNPIPVYYDSEFNEAAIQPLRTANGYVMRSGNPTRLYANTQFSVTVRDSSGAFVGYSPASVGGDTACSSGVVTRTNHTSDGSAMYSTGASPGAAQMTNIFVDGVYQPRDSYTLSGTNVTFASAPPLHAKIDIIVQQSRVAGSSSAELISYDRGGVGASQRTVRDKLQEFVSVEDFGAVGDGIQDDTLAIANAIAAEVPLYFGAKTYKITSPISFNVTKDLIWEGRGAQIVFESEEHQEYVVRLNDTAGVNMVIHNLSIDGSKLANSILVILNNTGVSPAAPSPTTLFANRLQVENCKRLASKPGGDAIFLNGAFDTITFQDCRVRDCELPPGQGTPAVIGISGITITWFDVLRYARQVTLSGTVIEKVYSSDPDYTPDQDGFRYFVPNDPNGGKVESNLLVDGGCRFVNCYGRSIKTQVRNTVVRDSVFQRWEGSSIKKGNGEIGSQTGSCVVNACTFTYRGGYEPGFVVGPSSSTGWKSAASITDCEVFLDDETVLSNFILPYPSEVVDPWTRMEVMRNRILGEVIHFVDFLTNSTKAHLTVSDNWVEEIGEGPTSERALIYVRTSGPSASYYAYVAANNNVYCGSNFAYLVRASVPGTGMHASVSATGNFGFVNDWNQQVNDHDPLRSLAQSTKITGLEASRNKGYFGMQTKFIGINATETFYYHNANASLIIVQADHGQGAYAIMSVAGSTQPISVGSAVAVGGTSNPGTGTFNIWRSGLGEISVENTDSLAHVVSIWVFSPN